MNEPMDEARLREAMAAEADRAKPDPRAWDKVSERVDQRRANPVILGAAALVLVVAGVAAALAFWPEASDEQPVVVLPPETTTTTEPQAPDPETTTTTTTDDISPEPEVVVDPIEMGPTPPTRDTRPDTVVAVLPDGWLATVDTPTGEVLERHIDQGDLREETEEGMRYGIWQVALLSDGRTTFFSSCCEPAAGRIDRWQIDGDNEHGPWAQGDNPMVTMTDRWVTGASYVATMRRTTESRHRSWSGGTDIEGMGAAVLTPDGSRMIVAPWSDFETGERRPMLLVRTDTVRRTVHESGLVTEDIIDDDPVELPSDRWTLPTFRRDGLLLVAEETGDGSWVPRLVDIDTFEVTDPGFDYGPGVPVMQRFDGSGEWLITLMADDLDPATFPTIGRLVWHGPDGQQGAIPGDFVSAAW